MLMPIFRNENQKGGPIPTPFFSKGSLVRDFYKGELSEALLRAKEGDLAFIMYYAPWDADSQIARKQFEAVSHQHYKQVSIGYIYIQLQVNTFVLILTLKCIQVVVSVSFQYNQHATACENNTSVLECVLIAYHNSAFPLGFPESPRYDINLWPTTIVRLL